MTEAAEASSASSAAKAAAAACAESAHEQKAANVAKTIGVDSYDSWSNSLSYTDQNGNTYSRGGGESSSSGGNRSGGGTSYLQQRKAEQAARVQAEQAAARERAHTEKGSSTVSSLMSSQAASQARQSASIQNKNNAGGESLSSQKTSEVITETRAATGKGILVAPGQEITREEFAGLLAEQEVSQMSDSQFAGISRKDLTTNLTKKYSSQLTDDVVNNINAKTKASAEYKQLESQQKAAEREALYIENGGVKDMTPKGTGVTRENAAVTKLTYESQSRTATPEYYQAVQLVKQQVEGDPVNQATILDTYNDAALLAKTSFFVPVGYKENLKGFYTGERDIELKFQAPFTGTADDENSRVKAWEEYGVTQQDRAEAAISLGIDAALTASGVGLGIKLGTVAAKQGVKAAVKEVPVVGRSIGLVEEAAAKPTVKTVGKVAADVSLNYGLPTAGVTYQASTGASPGEIADTVKSGILLGGAFGGAEIAITKAATKLANSGAAGKVIVDAVNTPLITEKRVIKAGETAKVGAANVVYAEGITSDAMPSQIYNAIKSAKDSATQPSGIVRLGLAATNNPAAEAAAVLIAKNPLGSNPKRDIETGYVGLSAVKYFIGETVGFGKAYQTIEKLEANLIKVDKPLVSERNVYYLGNAAKGASEGIVSIERKILPEGTKRRELITAGKDIVLTPTVFAKNAITVGFVGSAAESVITAESEKERLDILSDLAIQSPFISAGSTLGYKGVEKVADAIKFKGREKIDFTELGYVEGVPISQRMTPEQRVKAFQENVPIPNPDYFILTNRQHQPRPTGEGVPEGSGEMIGYHVTPAGGYLKKESFSAIEGTSPVKGLFVGPFAHGHYAQITRTQDVSASFIATKPLQIGKEPAISQIESPKMEILPDGVYGKDAETVNQWVKAHGKTGILYITGNKGEYEGIFKAGTTFNRIENLEGQYTEIEGVKIPIYYHKATSIDANANKEVSDLNKLKLRIQKNPRRETQRNEYLSGIRSAPEPKENFNTFKDVEELTNYNVDLIEFRKTGDNINQKFDKPTKRAYQGYVKAETSKPATSAGYSRNKKSGLELGANEIPSYQKTPFNETGKTTYPKYPKTPGIEGGSTKQPSEYKFTEFGVSEYGNVEIGTNNLTKANKPVIGNGKLPIMKLPEMNLVKKKQRKPAEQYYRIIRPEKIEHLSIIDPAEAANIGTMTGTRRRAERTISTGIKLYEWSGSISYDKAPARRKRKL